MTLKDNRLRIQPQSSWRNGRGMRPMSLTGNSGGIKVCQIPSLEEQRDAYRTPKIQGIADRFRLLRPNVIKRFGELRGLACGWDGEDALPVSDEMFELGTQFLIAALLLIPKVPDPTIVPMFDGRLQIEWQCENRELEIELKQGPSADVVMVVSGGEGKTFQFITIPLVTTENVLSAVKFVKWLVHGTPVQ